MNVRQGCLTVLSPPSRRLDISPASDPAALYAPGSCTQHLDSALERLFRFRRIPETPPPKLQAKISVYSGLRSSDQGSLAVSRWRLLQQGASPGVEVDRDTSFRQKLSEALG